MNYEIVNLEEKRVVGLAARTNNQSPEMGAVIGGLWEKFYGEGIYAQIENKTSDKALGIYTDYAGGAMDDYTIMVACEAAESKTMPKDTIVKTIPAGRYAKFVVKGDMHTAVANCWMEIWSMDLPRTFVSDFEEYQDDCMDGDAEIHIYVGLKK
ncbi:GyrI-like domain-containing protein [Emergencia sp.]|uniref:GyrI-like domain-containing protein n=1 Tax=Emergencia sp. TaxID=1926557 RepID=UPI003AF04D53